MRQKQFRMGFLCFFEKRTKTYFFSKKPNLKKTGGLGFFEKKEFFSTLTIFQSFLVIFP